MPELTTYSYNIDLTEMELVAVEAAIKFYIEECDRKIAQGDGAWAAHHKDSLLDVMAKRYKNATQTSGNNFGRSRSSADFNDWVQYDKDGKPSS